MNNFSLFVTGCGYQNCSDMHSWGPGVRQNYMIHYVLRGKGFLVTEGRSYRIKQGESFLTYPGKVINYYPDEEEPWEYTWIDFVGEDIPKILENTGFRHDNPVCTSCTVESETLKQYFNRLCKMDIYYRNKQEASGLLLAILGCYADLYPSVEAAAPEKKDGRLAKALMLIQSNYHKSEFHIGSLCAMLAMNRVALYRLFTSCLFCSPNEYLLNYRLEQAKKVLAQGFSVKQTALSCGFADQYYFSKAFKKHIGVPPSMYTIETISYKKNKTDIQERA